MNLRDRCAIVGVGQSPIGEVPDLDSLELLAEAGRRAIEESGLGKDDIDGLITRGPDEIYTHHQRIGEMLGLTARFSTSLDNGGASQCLAVATAAMVIEAGLATTVLCGYGRNTWTRTRHAGSRRGRAEGLRIPGRPREAEFGPEFGYFGAAATHAFGARRHMHLYGTTKAQMGAVAVTFREHALRNSHAQMTKPLTLDEYLAGRPIVEPFNVYDCSLNTDGAGAVIVTGAERARDLRHPPVRISGVGSFNNLRGWFFDDQMVHLAAEKSAEAAYRMAGIGPQEIDTAELYDCFTWVVIAELEAYGFCKRGEGGPFAASGALALDGAFPTNTSGGQLSEGHVEGMLQIVEAVRQLRHEYGPERQVKGCEVALVSGHGGNTVCHSTLILRR